MHRLCAASSSFTPARIPKNAVFSQEGRSAEVADKQDVARLVAFRQQQLIAIAGPREIDHVAAGEVGQRARRAAG
jgi:hypothetical protein